MQVRIHAEQELPRVNELVHDQWFEDAEIYFDETSQCLNIPFEREVREKGRLLWKLFFIKRLAIPIYKHELVVLHTKKFVVKDTANIGRYDFNNVEYDENLKKILITSGFPYSIEIWVDQLELQITQTDKLIRTKRTWSLV